MSLLQVRGVAKSFGSRLILDGLDLDVEPGARLGLIGPNGGGKSTLLRIVAGEESPDRGELTQRRGLVLAFLPQQLEGDERDPLDDAPQPRARTSTSSRRSWRRSRPSSGRPAPISIA